MSNERAVDLAVLLEHRSFVLRIARYLLRDPHDAEDVAQRTWMSVARDRPDGIDEPRGWLARITRNHAFNFARGKARRARREAGPAAPEPAEEPTPVSERVETAERVVRAVMALDEPIRSTVLMHYYDDLPTSAIAQRQGVSIDAVQWRLKRGLERVRIALEADGGAEWRAQLAVVVTAGVGAGAAAHALAPPLLAGIVVLFAAGVGIALHDTASPVSGVAASIAQEPAAVVATADEAAAESARTSAPAAELTDDSPTRVVLRGLVTDAQRRPIVGATVSRLGTDGLIELGRTDATGAFAVASIDAYAAIRIEAERYFPALRANVAPGANLQVVLEPATIQHGCVACAETGAPIAGAYVHVNRGRLWGIQQSISTQAAADGTFRLVVPLAPSTLSVFHGDFARWQSEAFLPQGDALEVRLVRNAAIPKREPSVYVRVTDAESGMPIEGVTFGDYGPSTALGSGEYFVTVARNLPGTSLVLWEAPGFQSMWKEFEDGLGASADDPLHLTLEPGAVCSGRVVDEHDAPLVGAAVSVAWSEADIPAAKRLAGASRIKGAATDADGRFTCDHLPRGRTITVSATAKSRLDASTTWVSGDREPMLRLGPVSTFELRIVDARTREPLDADDVRACSSPSANTSFEAEVVRIRRGAYTVTRGELELQCVVRADGFVRQESTIEPAAFDAGFEIALERGLEHAVLVRDSSGNPVANAGVEASFGTEGRHDIAAVTDADGVAVVRGLTSGRWSFIARENERQSPSQSAQLVGSGGRTTLSLPQLTGVRGNVRVTSGLAPTQVQVTWFRSQAPTARNVWAKDTGGSGAFFVGMEPLVGEPCSVAVDADGFETCTIADVVLSLGEIRDLEFVLVPKR